MPVASSPVATRPVGRSSRARVWVWVRAVGGLSVLAGLLWRLGAGPFLDGLRRLDAAALIAGIGLGAAGTLGAAWRWRLVAGGLGVRLALPAAVAAYYRSQFLNTALPGGVIGDVHRALSHGRDIGDVGRGVRAVVLERVAGQAVQIGVAVAVLAWLPSPVRSALPALVAVAVAVGLGLVLVARTLPRAAPARWVRALRGAGTEIHDGLLAHGRWLAIVVVSTFVVGTYLGMFVLAARTAGNDSPLSRLLPLGLLVLLAMAVPLNIGGWGPREGVAAWAFAAAGLTADQGVATAVVYGVLVLVGSLPGAAVLIAGWAPAKPMVPDGVKRG